MNVGFIGLGKLGLPVAVTLDMLGYDVMGNDLDPARMSYDPQPYQEAGVLGNGDFNDYLKASGVKFGSMSDVCGHADLIFVAVQTPHEPEYEGITVMPEKRVDFNYTHIKKCIADLADKINHDTVVVVISTCLPGTMRREIMPLLNEYMSLVYNPFFIAMGTVMRDYLHPEFVLLGVDDEDVCARNVMTSFYAATLPNEEQRWMTIESAELTKVAYNTYISTKIAYVNILMEICDKIPRADVDEVTDTLKRARIRLISGAYMTAGMGDGGGCHPRDNIAMSCLARELGLSYDVFESTMKARECQTQYLARLAVDNTHRAGGIDLPVVVLGVAFKPGTNITTGSPALLLAHYLGHLLPSLDKLILEDPVVYRGQHPYTAPAVFVVGCRHPEFMEYRFPRGSVVVDPWRMVQPQDGVELISVGGKDQC